MTTTHIHPNIWAYNEGTFWGLLCHIRLLFHVDTLFHLTMLSFDNVVCSCELWPNTPTIEVFAIRTRMCTQICLYIYIYVYIIYIYTHIYVYIYIYVFV